MDSTYKQKWSPPWERNPALGASVIVGLAYAIGYFLLIDISLQAFIPPLSEGLLARGTSRDFEQEAHGFSRPQNGTAVLVGCTRRDASCERGRNATQSRLSTADGRPPSLPKPLYAPGFIG